MNALLAALPGPLPLKLALLALPMLPNWWGIWHAYRHQFETEGERMLWMAACVLLPLLGGLAYILVGRARAMKPLDPSIESQAEIHK